MGTENIKTLIRFFAGIAERIDKVIDPESPEGKKITIGEWLGSVTLITGVPGLVKAIPELKDEYTDLDDAEREELIAFVQEEFDISNDNLENVIEKVFEIAFKLSDLADLFGKDKS